MDPDRHPEPDDYQRAWQAQSVQTRVTIDADLLLKEVQRHQRDFRATVFWRDFREVVVALLLIPVWFYLGYRTSSPWTWYLAVPTFVWTAGFMLVYRLRHPQRPGAPDEPLLECIKRSLTQVEDQIWLLRNVLWWYLLPPGIAILTFFAHVAWQSGRATNDWWAALAFAVVLFGLVLGVYGTIYYLNQFAVRKQLEPRRQELLTLLASLQDETAAGATDQVHLPALPFAQASPGPCSASPARIALTTAALIASMLLLVAVVEYLIHMDRNGDEFPKRSPFTAVRWQDSQPEVRVRGEWFQLIALNELPAAQIVAFSQRTYGNLWQKRFEEDLVELLTRMGHPPEDTVTLQVESLDSHETRVLEKVPMTYANRRAIREAAQAREFREQQQRHENEPEVPWPSLPGDAP